MVSKEKVKTNFVLLFMYMPKSTVKKQRISKKGLPPGTHVYTGEERLHEVKINVYQYQSDFYENFEATEKDLDIIFENKEHKFWIDVDGVHDIQKVIYICEKLGIHLLHQEDILNVFQRPKLEEEEEYTMVIIKMIHHLREENMAADVEQLGLIVKDNFLISFQEKKRGDVFDPVRERLQKAGTKLRQRNVDYLFYVLFDIVVDSYLENLVRLEEFQEKMEDEMMREVARYDLQNIQDLKKILLEHKKAILPLKEIMPRLLRSHKNRIEPDNHKFFMDLQDHVLMAYEMLESQLELHHGIKDMYLNRLNRDMNHVMKVLTIMSTIFIPLTFIAGVYGMNFKNMPELYTEYGYFITVSFMVLLGSSLLLYFKWKKWI